MGDPLDALQHSWYRRAYLILVCVLGIIVFQLTVIPRALRIACAHITLRRTRTRNLRYCMRGGPRNTLDVYACVDADKVLHPVVVFCHGGAWNSYALLSYLSSFAINMCYSVMLTYC
jgi:hypothetical protein